LRAYGYPVLNHINAKQRINKDIQELIRELIRTSSVKSSQRKAVLQAQKSIKNRLKETGEYYSGGNFTFELFSESEEPPMTFNIGELVY
jgi:peptide subunit release factor 1 (eRF1)